VAQCREDTGDVWLLGGPHPLRLSGRFALPVAQAIDGKRTMNEVAEAATATGLLTVGQANAVLVHWLTAGHVVSVTSAPPSPRVTIIGDDPSDVLALRRAVESGGVEIVDDADLTVVVVSDLLDVAESSHEGCWIPVRLRGEAVLVGPLLGPDHACDECLTARHQRRRSVDLVAARLAGLERPPVSPYLHPAAPSLAAGVIAAVVEARRHGKASLLENAVYGVDPTTLQSRDHALVPVPGCSTCDPDGSSAADREREHGGSMSLSSDGGGLRAVDPETTWRSYEHLVSDVLGVVPEVRLAGDPSLRVHLAGLNPAWSDREDLDGLRASLRQNAMGKGITIASSRAGALAEALERQSMAWRGDESVRWARMDELEGAIHPHDIQLYSATQHAAAEVVAPSAHRFHYVPRAFAGDREHAWVELKGLTQGSRAWIPAPLAYLGYGRVEPGGLRGCSNGVAAGNSVDEALLQGLLELVERDSVALWWYPRAHRPGVDLDAIDDSRVNAALAPLRARGREVWVLDITSDLGIPAMTALTSDADGGRVLTGFGAHVDPVIAVVRALTEVAQSEAGLSELTPASMPEVEGEWLAAVTTSTDPWLAPHGLAPLGHAQAGGLEESLDSVLLALANAGMQAWWMDLTRRDIGLPVVRTVVPGLRHFWNRFAPGRLYDVPRDLGWVARSYGEDDLNPRWVFV
jgi:bacteriocin biosynthesis cyclodehydratase domain-containing protein